MFTPAVRSKCKLRLALCGPSGSGKTYTALAIAHALGSRVAVIDSEAGSASKYAGRNGWKFDKVNLKSVAPISYVKAIEAADAAKYEVLIIDSLSHAWMGKDGALALVDEVTARSKSKNTFASWREVTPTHNALVEAILHCRCHVIATMRVHTEYAMETVMVDGKAKNEIRKIGLEPLQRKGVEYEFDLVGDIDLEHTLIVSKSRCSELDQAIIRRPDADLGKRLLSWLDEGEDAPEEPLQVYEPSVSKEEWAELNADAILLGWDLDDVRAFYKAAKAEGKSDLKIYGAACIHFGVEKNPQPVADERSEPQEQKGPDPEPEPPPEAAKPFDARVRLGQIMQAGKANGWRTPHIQAQVLKDFGIQASELVEKITAEQCNVLEAHVRGNTPQAGEK